MNITVRVSPEEEFEVAEEELKDLLPSLPMTAQVMDPSDNQWKTGSAYFSAKDERELLAQANAATLSAADKKIGGGAKVKLVLVLLVIGLGAGAFLFYQWREAKKVRDVHIAFARPYEEARAGVVGFFDCLWPADGGFKKIKDGKAISDKLAKSRPKGKATADSTKEESIFAADVEKCLPQIKSYVEALKAIGEAPEEYKEGWAKLLPDAEKLATSWALLAEDLKSRTERRAFNDKLLDVAKSWVEWGVKGKKGGGDAKRYVAWLACTYGDDADFATLGDSEVLVDTIEDNCKDIAAGVKWADDVRKKCTVELSKLPPEGKPPPAIEHGLKAFAGENLTAMQYTGCFEKVDKYRTANLERDIGDAFDGWLYGDTTIVNKYLTVLGQPPWAD
jgi:hypothetical protein